MNKLFKLIIAGGRDFENFKLMERKLNVILKNYNKEEIEIVSGMAKGADELGILYAKKYGIKVKEFPADWNQYGRSAGYIRNKEMAKYADACICFWNGISKGTKNMIEIARDKNLSLRIVNYGFRLKIEKSDIFLKAKDGYLAHCISADAGSNKNAMGMGIAVQFNKYFDMKTKLEDYSINNHIKVGEAILIDNVFNLITKERYFDKPTYETLAESLYSMKKICLNKNIKLIYCPKIGCGLDKLEFDKVQSLIKIIFEDTYIEIIVCVI